VTHNWFRYVIHQENTQGVFFRQRSRKAKLCVTGRPFLAGGRTDYVPDCRAHTDEKKIYCTKITYQIHTKCWALLILDHLRHRFTFFTICTCNNKEKLSHAKDISWQKIIEQYYLFLNTKQPPSRRFACLVDRTLDCSLLNIHTQKITIYYAYTKCHFHHIRGHVTRHGMSLMNTGVLYDKAVMSWNKMQEAPYTKIYVCVCVS
jgi:hypothetical protein